MKTLLVQKEQLIQQKDQGYNDLLQYCANISKNDKNVLAKLRDMKQRHIDAGVKVGGGSGLMLTASGNNTNMTTPDDT